MKVKVMNDERLISKQKVTDTYKAEESKRELRDNKIPIH